MAWARLDDNWGMHSKTVRAGLEASGLWVCCLTWANKPENRKGASPGVVPDQVVAMFAGSPVKARKLAATLHEVGYFDDHTSEGWPIHDFKEYLPKYTSEQAKAAGSKGGKASAKSKQTAKQTAFESSSETQPDWSQSA